MPTNVPHLILPLQTLIRPAATLSHPMGEGQGAGRAGLRPLAGYPAFLAAGPEASGEIQRPMGTKLPRLVFDTAALCCVSAMASESGAAGWLDYTPAWLKRIIGKNYEKKLPTAGLPA